jgi:hypothetical protein
MRYLADHPFLAGFVTALALVLLLRAVPTGTLTLSQTRALGLLTFGALFLGLGRAGLDRDDAFWIMLGGGCGVLITLPFVLGG